MIKDDFWAHSRELYGRTLLNEVAPFWIRHGIDLEFGGIGNVIDEAGVRVNNDKYLWSQGRALWTFSALCNRIESRPEWLGAAWHVYRYLREHGRNPQGHWNYRLSPDGDVLDGDISIYVDGFVLNGLAEFYKATGETAALDLAVATWCEVRRRIERPGSYGVAPYAVPNGLKTHGVAMVFSLFGFALGEIAGRDDIREDGLALADEILRDFYVPEKDAIVEYVSLEGEFVQTPAGRACVPGHALESLWFLIFMCERAGQPQRIPECCRLIRRHLELSWDEEFGGLLLALDIENREPVYWKKAQCKPWWVQVEALVATAYAHHHSRQPWAAEWHERIQTWAWSHYPSGGGEWTQWLDRRGRPMASAALPVKDPFHLPRALMVMMEVLGRSPANSPIALL